MSIFDAVMYFLTFYFITENAACTNTENIDIYHCRKLRGKVDRILLRTSATTTLMFFAETVDFEFNISGCLFATAEYMVSHFLFVASTTAF